MAFWLWKRDTGHVTGRSARGLRRAGHRRRHAHLHRRDRTAGIADLRRDGQGGWTVNGLPANPHPVELLLKTFLRVEVRSPVAKSAEANVLRIMAATARKVEIYTGGDEPEKIWYVGHATPDHFGTYMLLEIPGKGRSSVPFVMGMSGFSGFLTTRFHAKIDEWRSSVVFKYPDLRRIASVTVEHPAAPSSSSRCFLANIQLDLA